MRPSRRGLLILGAVLAVAGAIVLVTLPAHGFFDGEHYTCGTAFHSDPQGYRGAPGFGDCESTRTSLRLPVLGLAVLAVVLVVVLVRAYGPGSRHTNRSR